MKTPKCLVPACCFLLWEIRGLGHMVLEVPADLAVRASLPPATSKPALFLGERALICSLSEDLRVWCRVLGPGHIVWVPIWMAALTGLCLGHIVNLSEPLFCHLSKGDNRVFVRI